jgi:iron(III) transport system substrate-binding protein
MRDALRWCALLPALWLALPAVAKADDELIVYSSRNEHLIKPLFDLYTEKTGVTIRYVTDQGGPLIARLKAEGANTRADLLITVDAGNLWQAANEGLLAPVASPTLISNIPPHLRDADHRWFGLSARARTIVYSTERVDPDAMSTYEALAGPEWKGRLCLRTSRQVYNQSMVAMMIARLGAAETERVVRGWVANLAAPPFSNDTAVMRAIEAGQCDVGIVNSYYFGRLEQENPEIPLALFWANQDSGGVHVNVSGAGVTRHARNPDQAVLLLEWLASPEAQRLFAGLNHEYPVNPAVAPDPQVSAWGAFVQDERNISEAGRLQAQAVMLMDRAGYR